MNWETLLTQDFLNRELLGNTVQRWFVSLATLLLIMVATWLVRTVVVKRLRKITRLTNTIWDDLVLELISRTRFFLYFILVLCFSLQPLKMSEKVTNGMKGLFFVSLFLQMGLWGNYAINYLVSDYAEKNFQRDAGRTTTMAALGFLAKIFVWATVLLLLLDNFGINVSALVTGLGIGGVAIALAIQNILGDLFASLSIVLDKPFIIGDTINVDEKIGTVEQIGLKTTRLKSITGEQLIFPNSDLLKSRIRNYQRMQERRVVFTAGILYETASEKLDETRKIIQDVVESVEGVRFDRCHLANFGASSLDYEVVYWVLSADYNMYIHRHHEISVALVKAFRANGLDFAYPTRKLYVENVVTQP